MFPDQPELSQLSAGGVQCSGVLVAGYWLHRWVSFLGSVEELLGGGHCSVVRGLRGVSVHYSGGAVPRPVHFDPETKFNEEQIRAEVKVRYY